MGNLMDVLETLDAIDTQVCALHAYAKKIGCEDIAFDLDVSLKSINRAMCHCLERLLKMKEETKKD